MQNISRDCHRRVLPGKRHSGRTLYAKAQSEPYAREENTTAAGLPASFKWQVSPLLLYSLPWHRARTEPSRKVSCQSASCRATLFGGSREKCFAFRSRSVDGTEYVTTAAFSLAQFSGVISPQAKSQREYPRTIIN